MVIYSPALAFLQITTQFTSECQLHGVTEEKDAEEGPYPAGIGAVKMRSTMAGMSIQIRMKEEDSTMTMRTITSTEPVSDTFPGESYEIVNHYFNIGPPLFSGCVPLQYAYCHKVYKHPYHTVPKFNII